MQIEQTVIKVNGVVWNIVNTTNWVVERLGMRGRLIWRGKNKGRLVTTNKQNGRIMSVPFTTI